jgi:hypothetical protein
MARRFQNHYGQRAGIASRYNDSSGVQKCTAARTVSDGVRHTGNTIGAKTRICTMTREEKYMQLVEFWQQANVPPGLQNPSQIEAGRFDRAQLGSLVALARPLTIR